ncbi:MAG TPA: metalloregulator ArsR/SmtB family transcription factor [Thermomicrobiales bacterium]|nr:metalloregulator ArsR/SmtB family transcription factor [Thermomicrobiales bacterium]
MAIAPSIRMSALNAESCCAPLDLQPTLSADQAEEYAKWFMALSDPTRIRIMNLLSQSPVPVCVCDITDQFEVGQPTISHHLKILRDVRFVLAERRGTFMYYRVNDACLVELPEATKALFNLAPV